MANLYHIGLDLGHHLPTLHRAGAGDVPAELPKQWLSLARLFKIENDKDALGVELASLLSNVIRGTKHEVQYT